MHCIFHRLAAFGAVALLGLASVVHAQSVAQTFTYTGANQTFTVLADVTSINVYLWGAGEGSSAATPNAGVKGGGGTFISGSLSVTPNSTLTLLVGGGGTASITGGSGSRSGPGGASGVTQGRAGGDSSSTTGKGGTQSAGGAAGAGGESGGKFKGGMGLGGGGIGSTDDFGAGGGGSSYTGGLSSVGNTRDGNGITPGVYFLRRRRK